MCFWFWKSNHTKTIWFLILFRRNVAFWPYCRHFRSKTSNFDNTVIIFWSKNTKKYNIIVKMVCFSEKVLKTIWFLYVVISKIKKTYSFWSFSGRGYQFWPYCHHFLLKTNHFDHTVAIFQPSRPSQPGQARCRTSFGRTGNALRRWNSSEPASGSNLQSSLFAIDL